MIVLAIFFLAHVFMNYKVCETWSNSEFVLKVMNSGICYPILEVSVCYIPLLVFPKDLVSPLMYSGCLSLIHGYLLFAKKHQMYTILFCMSTTFYLKWIIFSTTFLYALLIEVIFSSSLYTTLWTVSRYTRDRWKSFASTSYERELFDIDE